MQTIFSFLYAVLQNRFVRMLNTIFRYTFLAPALAVSMILLGKQILIHPPSELVGITSEQFYAISAAVLSVAVWLGIISELMNSLRNRFLRARGECKPFNHSIWVSVPAALRMTLIVGTLGFVYVPPIGLIWLPMLAVMYIVAYGTRLSYLFSESAPMKRRRERQHRRSQVRAQKVTWADRVGKKIDKYMKNA